MSRRPRGSAASLLRELKYTIRVLAPCANGTVARHAIELAQEPPGPGARALPRPLRRGLEVLERAASRVEPGCRGQDASLHCLLRAFDMDLVRVRAAYLTVPLYPGCWTAVLPY